MAKSISAEELELRKRARRRLIGAIALVTIVAVFLPMALDHEPKPLNQDISIRIPSPNSGAFTSKIVPVVPEAKSVAKPPSPGTPVQPEAPVSDGVSTVTAAAATKPAADPQTPRVSDAEMAPPILVVTEQPAAQAKQKAKHSDKRATAPKAAADSNTDPAAQSDAKRAGAYLVQVVALNDADKAKQIQDQIAAAGVKSFTQTVPTQKGNVTRVRAGPFATRGEAEETRDKLKAMGLNGNLIAQ